MHVIENLSPFLNHGEHLNTKTYFQKKNKKKAFSTIDRVQISSIYHWIGENSHSKLLKGKIDTLNETLDLSVDDLIEFVRKTHHLNFLGAHKTAKKRYDFLIKENLIEKVEKKYPQVNNSLGNHYLQTFDFNSARIYFKKAAELIQIGTSAHFFAVISEADSLAGLEDYTNAISLIKKVEAYAKTSPMLDSIYHQVKGDYHLRNSEISKAEEELKHSKRIFVDNKINNKDFAYCLISLGMLELVKGSKDSAKEYIKKAYGLLSGANSSILPLYELAFINNHYNLKIEELKGLENLNLSYYSFPYRKVLKMSLGQQNQSKTSSKTPQEKIILLLTAAGKNGLFEGYLLEQIYEDTIYSELELDKLKKLIKRIRSKGVNIYSKDRFYYLNQ